MFLKNTCIMLPWLFSLTTAWTTVRTTPLTMGVVGSMSNTARRVRDSLLAKERSREDLKLGIAGFYDRSSKLWEDVWGEVCVYRYVRTQHKLYMDDTITLVHSLTHLTVSLLCISFVCVCKQTPAYAPRLLCP